MHPNNFEIEFFLVHRPTEYNSQEQNDYRFFEKDPALRNLMRSKLPVWLNVPQSYRTSKNELCGRDCELEGICWANVLGSSAQSGFKVVFQRVNKNEMINPSLNYYVSLLHKKVMGEKVYDTKILNGDSLSPKYFTHCTRNVSGSFSVMGVNFADYKTKISTKLAQKYTGSEIYQYVLNVDAGQILFNGVPVEINSDFQPIVKVKKPNRLTTFTLPPRSIGFWVFPLANLKQCSTKSDTEIVSPVQASIYNDFEHSSRTASEKLLHELIAEIVQMDSERNEVKRARRHAIVKKDSKHMNRNKRSADPGYKTRRAAQLLKKFNGDATKRNLPVIGLPRRRVTRQINNANLSNNRFSKLFKAFELPQPKKFTMAKFWNLSPPAQNTIPQNLAAIPPVTSTIHDIYRVDPSEQQIFKSVENSELPTGDVFYQVGEERNMDYVEFEDKADKFGKRLQQNKHPMESEKFVDFDVDDVQNVPDHMYEFYNEARDKKQAHPEMVPYTELWESDVYQKAPPPQNSQPIEQHRHFEEDSNNHEQNIDLIVKELPPTFRQNQENLMKAKSKLSAIYMNDGDRMSSTNIRLPMRHVDMDDDGFFVSKRKRRSISAGLNDEIENKLNNLKKAGNNNVGEELDDGYVDFLNKNGGKINLLEKITKIIESLEKIDDIGKYNNIEKLNSEIKELENFLFKRSSKFGLLKPKNRVTQKEIRRKCKILSVNLEQQCLKENDFYPSRLLSRDAKQTSDFKAMKMPPLKNAFPAKKSDNSNRVRRNAAYETSSSWEADDRANMIVKEMYSTNEFNDFVPSVSFKKTVRVADQPNEEKDEYIERVAVLQNLPESFSPNNVMQISAEQHRPVPTFSIDTGLDGRVIEKDIDNDQEAKEYQTPRFMKKISKSVQDWMNIVEKHVSGWWHIIS